MILAAFRAEWFKLSRRPAVWVTIGLLLALTLGIGYLVTYLVATHPPSARDAAELATLRPGLYPAALVSKALSNANTLDAIFALILGALAQGSEYGWGTVKTARMQLPGRLAILSGQLFAVTSLMLVATLLVFASGAAASCTIAVADGHSIAFASGLDILKGIGGEWLIFEFAAVFGFGLATVFRQSAMAIGLGLGYVLLVEALAFALLVRLGDAFKTAHELFPMANSQYLQNSFGQVGGIVGVVIAARSEPTATHAVVALALWIVGIAVLCAALDKQRDIL
ncbi:MAG TPA: hypothetical protein VGO86_15115 [Candidatus Dormibacteraeota bacterium]